MVSIILDVINVLDAETSSLDTSTEYRAGLGYIVKSSEKVSAQLTCLRTS